MIATVIVGVDGRDHDAEAIALAEELVAPDGTIVLATVAVVADPAAANPDDAETLELAEELIDRLTEARDDVQGVAIAARSIGDGLRELAEGTGAGLTVVASSRRGLIDRVFLGDSVRGILAAASGPVCVAPVGYRHGG